MKYLIIPLIFLFTYTSYSQNYQTNYLEVFENGKKIAGSSASDKIVVDEKNNKIFITNPDPQYKTFIIKIIKKFPSKKYDENKKEFVLDNESFFYSCEIVNQHGTVKWFLIFNTFYQTIKLISFDDNGDNYSLWNYSKVE